MPSVNEAYFLSESNAIEGIFDEGSLSQAIRAWNYLKEQEKLTLGVILKTHKILMIGQNIQGFERGYFRRRNVYIGGEGSMHHSKVLGAMYDWLDDVKTSIKVPGKNGKHIKFDHITYEKIHPFIDGNGRTGRMFLNYQRLKANLPLLIIKESEKQKYYRWFT